MSVFADTFVNIASSVAGGLLSLKTILVAVVEANNNAFTTFYTCVANFVGVVAAILNFICVVLSTVVAFFVDFALECMNFITAFLYLVWKLFILIYSVLDLVFRFLECLFYFIWTGGKWTAETIKVSGHSLTKNGLGTWKLFVLSLKEFTNSLLGGFTIVGQFVEVTFEYIIHVLYWCYTTGNNLLVFCDLLVRDACNYIFDSVYFFLCDYLLNMPKEVYLGIVVCSLSAITLKNIVCHMTARGFTFPLQPFQSSSYDSEDEEEDSYIGRGDEFSDDEMADLTNNQDVSDSSEEDESDSESNFTNSDVDEEEELELVDSSDSEEDAASEFSEINIQLPDMNRSYNPRRSTTPARFHRSMSPAEVEKVIEREKEKRMCVVCQDQQKSVLILPCRHMCLCVECGNHIARTQHRERRVCPLCRTKIKTIMNVYL